MLADKFGRADILYVGGGNTLRLMTLLRAGRCGPPSGRRPGPGRRALRGQRRSHLLVPVRKLRLPEVHQRQRSAHQGQRAGLLPVLLCPHYDAEPLRQTDLPG